MNKHHSYNLSGMTLSQDNNKGILGKGYKGYVVDRVSKIDSLEGGREK